MSSAIGVTPLCLPNALAGGMHAVLETMEAVANLLVRGIQRGYQLSGFVLAAGTVTLEVALVSRYWTTLFFVFLVLSYVLVFPFQARAQPSMKRTELCLSCP